MPDRRRLARCLSAALIAGALAPGAAHAAPPRVIAPSAIVVEPATGDIVFQRRATKRLPIASTTKMMTALLTIERLSLDDVLAAAPYRAQPAESVLGLRTGQRMTVRDYLRALMLQSANDAAHTLAQRIAGSTSAFVRMMNARAQELKLSDTHFANPIGLDSPSNYSTATDLVKLALILREKPFLRETMDMASATVRPGGKARRILNRNLLVRGQPFVNGVKTGHTNTAGYILVGSATRDGITVVSAVLGDPTEAARDQDTLRLLRYATSRYRITTVTTQGQRLASAKLRYRDESVDLVAARSVRETIRRGERTFTRVRGAPKELDGPLDQGARVGTIEVRYRGKTVDRVPLVTARAVSEATATQRLADFLSRSGTILALSVLVGCSLVLVLLRRRILRRGPRQAGVA
ncbi:MAG TPA: D-alanyl-D-alanine carboxypeptidase family protein [Solirubrobacteraceae bacterium]